MSKLFAKYYLTVKNKLQGMFSKGSVMPSHKL